jgi:exosortase/archaeosortase family protein
LVAADAFLAGFWRKSLLVLFMIPLAILRNGFRIVVIGWLCLHIGPSIIESPFHRHGGPLFFALSLPPLFLVLWWLHRQAPPRPATRKTRPGEEAVPANTAAADSLRDGNV